MSPREKESYHDQEVELPEDHYDMKGPAPTNKKKGTKIWWSLAVTAAVVFVSILLLHKDSCMQHQCVTAGKDNSSTSTSFRIDHEYKRVDQILLDLNRSLEGRVWISSRDNPEDFAIAAFVWRQDLKPPRAVVEAATEADVQLAVPVLDRLQKEHGIPFRIRSGGHSKAGFSTVADGMVLSLKHLKSRSILVEGNPSDGSALATIEPGSTVENVLDKFLEHADTNEELYGGALGQCGNVAEGGWVLGGGVGFMARLLGLGVDNVRSFRLVLANATVVTANDKENADLFWALRGAGQGNYGVVTSMTYQLRRVPDTQLFQKILMPIEDSASYFYKMGELKNTDGEFFSVSGGSGLVVMSYTSWFSLEDDLDKNVRIANDHFDREIRPILPSSATPESAYENFLWAEDTHTMFDQGYGEEVYAAQPWQGFLMPANNTQEVWDAIISLMTKGIEMAPDLQPHIELWGGKISEVAVAETAFPYRDAVYNLGVLLVVQDYDETAQQRFEQQVESVNSWWPLVAEYLTGSYQNYPMNSLGENEHARLYWGDHLEKLVETKRRYDPTNTFSFEQSMPLIL